MKNFENKINYSNDKVKNYEKKNYREFQRLREDNKRPNRDNDYNKYADYKAHDDGKGKDSKINETTTIKANKIIDTVKPLLIPTTVIAVAATYGVGFLTPPETTVKDLNALTIDSALVLEIDFDNVNPDEKLSIEVSNDFTKRIMDIDQNLIEPENLIYTTNVENLNDNASYDIKILDDKANLIFSKQVTFGLLRSRSKIGDVHLEVEHNLIYFDGYFDSYYPDENLQIILKNDTNYQSYEMTEFIEPNREDKTFFYGSIPDLENNEYQFYIATRKDTLYSTSFIIDNKEVNSIVSSFEVNQEGNECFVSLIFEQYDPNDQLYLELRGDDNRTIELDDLRMDGEYQYFDTVITDLMVGGSYYLVLTNGYIDVEQREILIEDIGNNPVTNVSDIVTNLSNNILDLSIYFTEINLDENVIIKFSGNNLEEEYSLNDYLIDSSDGTYFNKIIENLDYDSTYMIEVYANDVFLSSKQVYVEKQITSSIDKIVVETSRGQELEKVILSFGGDFTTYDEEDNLILIIECSDNSYYKEVELKNYISQSAANNSYTLNYDNEEVDTDYTYQYRITGYGKEIYAASIDTTRVVNSAISSFYTSLIDSTNLNNREIMFNGEFSNYVQNEELKLYLINDELNYESSYNLAEYTTTNQSDTELTYYFGFNSESVTAGYTYRIEIRSGKVVIYNDSVEVTMPHFDTVVDDIEFNYTNKVLEYRIVMSSFEQNEYFYLHLHNDNYSQDYNYTNNVTMSDEKYYTSGRLTDLEYSTTYIFDITNGTTVIFSKEYTMPDEIKTEVDYIEADGLTNEINLQIKFNTFDENENVYVVITNNKDITYNYDVKDYYDVDTSIANIGDNRFTEGETYDILVKAGDVTIYSEAVKVRHNVTSVVAELNLSTEDTAGTTTLEKSLIINGILSAYDQSDNLIIRINNNEGDMKEIELKDYIEESLDGSGNYLFNVSFENVVLNTTYTVEVLSDEEQLANKEINIGE